MLAQGFKHVAHSGTTFEYIYNHNTMNRQAGARPTDSVGASCGSDECGVNCGGIHIVVNVVNGPGADSKMMSRILSLQESATIQLADAYGDGTVWFSLRDSEGQIAEVCIDGRVGSETRFRLFDGARHPKLPDARLVDLGAPEEGIVISLAATWLDSGNPKNLGLTEYGWEMIRDVLSRIGELD